MSTPRIFWLISRWVRFNHIMCIESNLRQFVTDEICFKIEIFIVNLLCKCSSNLLFHLVTLSLFQNIVMFSGTNIYCRKRRVAIFFFGYISLLFHWGLASKIHHSTTRYCNHPRDSEKHTRKCELYRMFD